MARWARPRTAAGWRAWLARGAATVSRSVGCSLTALALVSAAAMAVHPSAGAAQAGDPQDAAAVARGQAIYETGARSNGRPIPATREGFGAMPPGLGACVQCHRPSGLGDREARLLSPPLAGNRLFEPLHRPTMTRANPKMQRQPLRALDRPAYTADSLARALRSGIDPAGRALNAAMPRFALSGDDVGDLVAYLRTLGRTLPAGARDGQMHLATVITPDADPVVAHTVETTLSTWASQLRLGDWQVHWQVWRLTGPPAGWPAQLEARWRQQPVFALVSGAGGGHWDSIDAFCEARRVACVLPSLPMLPAAAAAGRHHNVYFSAGVVGEAHLYADAVRTGAVPRQPVFNCVVALPNQDARAESAGAQALTAALQRLKVPVTQCSGSPQQVAQQVARQLGAEGAARRAAAQPVGAESGQPARPPNAGSGKPSIQARGTGAPLLVLWARPEAVQALADSGCCSGMTRLLSAQLAPPHRTPLPEGWRERTRWLSVQADAIWRNAGATMSAVPWTRSLGLSNALDPVALAEAHAATFFFTDALARMREGFSTDYLLERLEAAVDRRPAGSVYYRLSLGPNLRVAAQHGRLLAVNSADPPLVVPVSPLLRAGTE